jgi:hypothetical protein
MTQKPEAKPYLGDQKPTPKDSADGRDGAPGTANFCK